MIRKSEIPWSAGRRVVDLIERYKHFASEKQREADSRAEELRAKLGIFWPQFDEARAAYADHERTEASRFCLIRILGLGEMEKTHSRILADLLNPQGTHGQGRLFLEGFLDHIGLADVQEKLISNIAHVTVMPELAVTGEARPDIVVSCVPWFLIVIENKIRSGEGYEQLKKYRIWLCKQKAAEKRLVYLTIHGKPSQRHEEDCSLSYARDVRQWLGRCLENVAAPAVTHSLRRYLETIADFR